MRRIRKVDSIVSVIMLTAFATVESCTALGELLGHDFGSTSLTRLYRVSDQLLKHQAVLEGFLADQEQCLFDLNRRIVLYDLNNTYFEGQCACNPKALGDLKRNDRIVL